MNKFETCVKINVLLLVSSHGLIGMDCLEHHWVVLNCFDKTFTSLNNEGETVIVKGIPRKTSIRKSNTAISRSNQVIRLILEPELLKNTELTMKQVRGNLKVSHDKHKRQADLKWTEKEFHVGEHVFIKIKPKKSSLKLGSCAKIAPRYCGTFEIFSIVRLVAYQLALPLNLKVHNVFHIYVWKQYVEEATHVIKWNDVHLELERDFLVDPNCILHQREILL